MPTLTDRRGTKKVGRTQVGDGWVRAVTGVGRSRAAWRARCGEWTEVKRLRGVVSGRLIFAAVASKQIEWTRENPTAGTNKERGVRVECERSPKSTEEQSTVTGAPRAAELTGIHPQL